MSRTKISKSRARKIWLQSQGLLVEDSFGKGSAAILAAISQLGYVQIDTINVIERSHHHILYNRISDYKRSHLLKAQTIDKSIFEYWTHALAYIPTKDFKYFINDMTIWRKNPNRWYSAVTSNDIKNIVSTIRNKGPITIRDINDEVLTEKTHLWSSKKPSKGILQTAFYAGELAISERKGMLKKYHDTKKHFNWKSLPKGASAKEVISYKVERAIRSQGIISVDSAGYLEKVEIKKEILKNIKDRVKNETLIEVEVESLEKFKLWINPDLLEKKLILDEAKVNILSPFDPLVIQRKRLNQFFDYEHKFEAYIPKEKRVYGYFALPVLIGDTVVAVIDLKADRQNRSLLIQQWTWLKKYKSKSNKTLIESALDKFEKFQFAETED